MVPKQNREFMFPDTKVTFHTLDFSSPQHLIELFLLTEAGLLSRLRKWHYHEVRNRLKYDRGYLFLQSQQNETNTTSIYFSFDLILRYLQFYLFYTGYSVFWQGTCSSCCLICPVIDKSICNQNIHHISNNELTCSSLDTNSIC